MIDECTFCGHYGYLKRIDGRYLCKHCSRAHLAYRQPRHVGNTKAHPEGHGNQQARR